MYVHGHMGTRTPPPHTHTRGIFYYYLMELRNGLLCVCMCLSVHIWCSFTCIRVPVHRGHRLVSDVSLLL